MHRAPLLALLALSASACSGPPAGAARGGGGSGSTTTSSTSTTTSTTGSGGGGGSGGGDAGSTFCTPGQVQACYTGPPGTEGVGACKVGAMTCSADGSAFGACTGQVTPQPEDCATPEDDDCNGQANDGCLCSPGALHACYTGPAGTLGVGICQAGQQTCSADGHGYGPCTGEVTPVPETCLTPVDDDCNGMTNEGGAGCVCLPSSTSPCYTGPAGTLGVGACRAGQQTCDALGLSYGPCTGEVTPVPETCLTPVDDDCNGMTNEGGAGCVCLPSSASPCYTGPAGTLGVGVCAGGKQVCDAQGTSEGPCLGQVLPSVDDCNTPLDEDCDGTALACAGPPQWSLGFGDAVAQQARAIAFAPGGDAVITGQFQGSISFGGAPLASLGADDVFVARLSAAGAPVWSRRFGDGAEQTAAGVAVDAAGAAFVTGTFQGNVDFGGGVLAAGNTDQIFVSKLSAAGDAQWSKYFPGGPQHADGIAVDASGNVAFVGQATCCVNLGGGQLIGDIGEYAVIAKYTGAGVHVYSGAFGGSGNNTAEGIAVAFDPAGDMLFTGRFQYQVVFGAQSLTSATFDDDVFLAKLDPTGAPLWALSFGGPGAQIGQSVAADAAGNVYLAGSFEGTIDLGGGPLVSAGADDIFLAKLDPAGNHLWSKRFGDALAHQQPTSVTVDRFGDPVLVGYFYGTVDLGGGPLVSAGQDDGFVAKFDASGHHLWSRRFGDPARQRALGVATDASGDVGVVGFFQGTTDFGGGPRVSAGSSDVFVARYGQ